MNASIIIGMLNNSTLLLSLGIVYEISYLIPVKSKKIISIINGVIIGVIGIAIMAMPLRYTSGIMYDTRTILISVTALAFGSVPTIIAAALTIIYRIILGGDGLYAGVSTIFIAAIIGLLWRKWLFSYKCRNKFVNTYAFGLLVSISMVLCQTLLPQNISLNVMKQITLPVLIIFPLVTVILCKLLLNQKERIQTLARLKEAENRYKSIFETNQAAMLIINTDNERIIDANPASAKLFEFSTEQLKNMKIRQLVATSDEQFEEIVKDFFDNKKNVLHLKSKNSKGNVFDVEVYTGRIIIDNLNYLYIIVHDISDKVALEARKNEIESQLHQQQKLEAIGTLAGGVAHEINNPLSGIMNYAQLILDSVEKDSKNAQFAEEIISETDRISVIVKNLLNFSRQEKQAHSYASIYDIINQTVSLIRTIIKKDQISLEISLDENLPDIKCRSQQIQQVLMNLLTNARDALNAKFKEYNEDKIIRITCSQYTADDRRWIRISVEDHGNGIPKEISEKIYQPFFSTKPKDKGTGLGLSISFGIIKDHHGFISFDTVEGSNTVFNVDLPVDNGWNL